MERGNCESTRAAVASGTALSGGEEEATREHRAESRRHQSSRQLVGREPRATATATGLRAPEPSAPPLQQETTGDTTAKGEE